MVWEFSWVVAIWRRKLWVDRVFPTLVLPHLLIDWHVALEIGLERVGLGRVSAHLVVVEVCDGLVEECYARGNLMRDNRIRLGLILIKVMLLLMVAEIRVSSHCVVRLLGERIKWLLELRGLRVEACCRR